MKLLNKLTLKNLRLNKVTGERDVFFNSQNRDKIVELIDNPHLSAAEYGKLVIIHFAFKKRFITIFCGMVNLKLPIILLQEPL